MDPPEKPDESDCCNSGCNPCIFDVYDEQLRRYEKHLTDPVPTAPNCIDPLKYTTFKLIAKIKHTADTSVYVFEYDDDGKRERKTFDDEEKVNSSGIFEADDELIIEDKVDSTDNDGNRRLSYKPGQHFLLKACSRRDRMSFTRAYTPIPWDDLKPRQFAVLIRFYETGQMSDYLERLQLGAGTSWRGPYGDYEPPVVSPKHLLMIAQGTGIAPLYSVLIRLLNDEECEAVVKLFYCCRDVGDILLRDALYGYWNFGYEVFVSRGGAECAKYGEVVHGERLNCTAIDEYMSGKGEHVEVLVCGNEGFENCISEYVKKCDVRNVYLF